MKSIRMLVTLLPLGPFHDSWVFFVLFVTCLLYPFETGCLIEQADLLPAMEEDNLDPPAFHVLSAGMAGTITPKSTILFYYILFYFVFEKGFLCSV